MAPPSPGRSSRPWWLLAPLASAVLPVAKAQIRVLSPQSLASRFSESRGWIEGSTATFGAPFFGQRLLGRLAYGEPKTGHPHCREDDYEVPPPDNGTALNQIVEAPLLHILLVRRGGCSFVTKVKVAQNKGAHAVIIVDKKGSRFTAQEMRRIIMADDGFGASVKVPSILISYMDGKELIEAAKNRNRQVIVDLNWNVPTNRVVLVDLWMSSASQESMRFLRDWAPTRRAFNHAIAFTPHYAVFRMPGDVHGSYSDLCSSSSGAFCAEDPDGPGPITGKMVVDEDVRQLCIHELYSAKRGHSRLADADGDKLHYAREYWAYMESLLGECPLHGEGDKRFGAACSRNLMQSVGIDVAMVEDCVMRTKADKLSRQLTDVAWSPRALRINGWRYAGAVDVDVVTRAICAGFVTQPAACDVFRSGGGKPGLETCDDNNTVDGDGCSHSGMVEVGYQCVHQQFDADMCQAICGDGLRMSSESCDDGNIHSSDGCSDSCAVESGWSCSQPGKPCKEICGDGKRVGSETCDDANRINGDGCSFSCAVEPGWDCVQLPNQSESCRAICGDGVRQGLETCDDLNTETGDGCSGSCLVEPGWSCREALYIGDTCQPICGDGLRIDREACEDGNVDNGDGCSHLCQVEDGWSCILGPGQSLSDTCQAICGDGKIVASEGCDDGNKGTGDGCSDSCKVERGWGCPTPGLPCKVPEGLCGDGLRVGSEQCDDGDISDGDGCSSLCVVESGWTCHENPHNGTTCEVPGGPAMSVLRNIKRFIGRVRLIPLFMILLVILPLASAALMLYKRSRTQRIRDDVREEVMAEIEAQMEYYRELS